MKKITHLIIAVLIFSIASSLEAENLTLTNRITLASMGSFIKLDSLSKPIINSWKDPKTAHRLIVSIEAKIANLNKDKCTMQAKLKDINNGLNPKQKDKTEAALKDINSRLSELNTLISRQIPFSFA